MWGETVVTFSDVDYRVFPRLTALAELGWSPKADRTGTNSAACSPATVRAAEALWPERGGSAEARLAVTNHVKGSGNHVGESPQKAGLS